MTVGVHLNLNISFSTPRVPKSMHKAVHSGFTRGTPPSTTFETIVLPLIFEALK